MASYRIEDFSEGQKFSFRKTITEADVDNFASLSGDISFLHTDDQFARRRGFKGRVVHGALLISYLSKLVGVYFPGKNCLLQSVSSKFLSPAYINDTVEISAVVDQVSLAVNAIVLRVDIKDTNNNIVLVKSKIQVGFSKVGDTE